MTLKEAIQHAREIVDKDPELAIFMVRDYAELKAWEDLHTLAWLMSHEYTCVSEAKWLLDKIESKLSEGDTK